MICVVATIQLKPGCRSKFLDAFNANVPAVLAEDGCLEYMPTVDIDAELAAQAVDEDRVVVIEKWESIAALKDHLQAPHMLEYRETVKDMVQNVALHVLQPAGA